MKFNIFKFIIIGIFVGFLFNILYSYVNYFLLLNNSYFNPRVLSIAFICIYFIAFINFMPKYYKNLFDLDIINKKMFLVVSFIPLISFGVYLAVLTNIYYDLSFTNYKMNKAAMYTVRTISSNIDNEIDINQQTTDFISMVLNKEQINADDFVYDIKIPNNSINYGSNFVLNIKDTRNYTNLKYYTLVPFSSELRWMYFYNFTNGNNIGEKENISVSTNIKYSTPYGDYN